MSKAEERALEAFPLKIDGDSRGSYDLNVLNRQKFLLGYHQAEKDLKLTLEDIRELHVIFADVDVDIELCKTDIKAETLGYYEEVLKRFNKERKEV